MILFALHKEYVIIDLWIMKQNMGPRDLLPEYDESIK